MCRGPIQGRSGPVSPTALISLRLTPRANAEAKAEARPTQDRAPALPKGPMRVNTPTKAPLQASPTSGQNPQAALEGRVSSATRICRCVGGKQRRAVLTGRSGVA